MEGIKSVEGIETAIDYIKEINLQKIATYDALVLGAPNHMGRPSRTMKIFVNRLALLDMRAKHIAVFGTYSGKVRNPDRAVRKLETIVKQKLPDIELVSPSLSVRVNGVSGPIVEGELPKCADFGKEIAKVFL